MKREKWLWLAVGVLGIGNLYCLLLAWRQSSNLDAIGSLWLRESARDHKDMQRFETESSLLTERVSKLDERATKRLDMQVTMMELLRRELMRHTNDAVERVTAK